MDIFSIVFFSIVLNVGENMINHILSYETSWWRSYNILLHAKTSATYKRKKHIKAVNDITYLLKTKLALLLHSSLRLLGDFCKTYEQLEKEPMLLFQYRVELLQP